MNGNKRTPSNHLWIFAILIGFLALSFAPNIGCMDGDMHTPPNTTTTTISEGEVSSDVLGIGKSSVKWKRTVIVEPTTQPTTQPVEDAVDDAGNESGTEGNDNGAQPVGDAPTTTPPAGETNRQAGSLMGDETRGDVIVDVVIDDMGALMQAVLPSDTPTAIQFYGLPVGNLPELANAPGKFPGTPPLRVTFITDNAVPTGPLVDVHVSGTFAAVVLWMRDAGFLWIEVADGRPETAGQYRTRIDFFPPGDPNGSRLQVERGYIEPQQIEVYPLAPRLLVP